MIIIKSQREISLMREAGRIVAKVFEELEKIIVPGVTTKEIEKRYKKRTAWARSCLINIAKSGYFSSDRTIEQYVDDIWHLEKIK